MKKTIIVAMFATTIFACSTPAEKKTETTSAPSTTGSVTTEGPEVDLMKKAAESWANANWDAYLSCYADTARSVHNAWASNDTTIAKKVSSYINQFKKSREAMEGNVTINNGIYEVVTMPDGSKYGHVWLDISWKTKKGEIGKTVIFNSYGIKDGKFTYEWPIYDTKDFEKLPK